jgi:hypothetical protein
LKYSDIPGKQAIFEIFRHAREAGNITGHSRYLKYSDIPGKQATSPDIVDI